MSALSDCNRMRGARALAVPSDSEAERFSQGRTSTPGPLWTRGGTVCRFAKPISIRAPQHPPPTNRPCQSTDYGCRSGPPVPPRSAHVGHGHGGSRAGVTGYGGARVLAARHADVEQVTAVDRGPFSDRVRVSFGRLGSPSGARVVRPVRVFMEGSVRKWIPAALMAAVMAGGVVLAQQGPAGIAPRRLTEDRKSVV